MTWSYNLFRFYCLDLSIEYIEAYVAYLIQVSHHHPKEHTILYVFRAPGYNSPIPLSWYKQIV